MDSVLGSRTDLPAQTLRDRALARLSVAFVLDQVTTGIGALSARDAVLVMAINQANIAPLTRDPSARRRYGALEAAAPDTERRPVSVNAVAASLRLPFETVRRRVGRLNGLGVCVTAKEGVVVPETFLASGPYLQSLLVSHRGPKDFYEAAVAGSLLGKMPPSNYPSEGDVPVRAAARLLSDYLLRTCETLMAGVVDDVVSMLILFGILRTSMDGLVFGPQTPEPGVTVAALSRMLGIPDETVRRHVERLVDQGRCQRGRQGFVVTEAAASSPALADFFHANTAYVRRLFTALAERGVIDAWTRTGQLKRVRA